MSLPSSATAPCPAASPAFIASKMRRALVTAFGNARLDDRYRMEPEDLPRGGPGKGRIGFLQ